MEIMPNAKRSHLAVVMAGCALWFLSTLHSSLMAQESPSPDQSIHGQSASPSDEHERILLPAGTEISVRIADRVDTNHLHSGDLLTGIVDPSLMYNDRVVIPRGTEAHMHLAENKKGGHLVGKAEVQIELTGLVMNGQEYEVVSDTYHKDQGTIAAKTKAAGPASAGAGADVATGSGYGVGVSPVVAIFHAAKVDLPPETRVKFTLTVPLSFDKPREQAAK
jgi:hypothetical protein